MDAAADALKVEQERVLVAWIDGVDVHRCNCNGNRAYPLSCVFRFVTVLGVWNM